MMTEQEFRDFEQRWKSGATINFPEFQLLIDDVRHLRAKVEQLKKANSGAQDEIERMAGEVNILWHAMVRATGSEREAEVLFDETKAKLDTPHRTPGESDAPR